MKPETETKNRLVDEVAFSKFIVNKLTESKDEVKHSNEFIKGVLAEYDLMLYAADAMAKELHKDSVARYKYELLKAKFNIN